MLNLDTIGKKFLIPTITLVTVMLVFLGFFLINNQKSSIQENMLKKGQNMVNIMDKTCYVHVMNFDTEALEKVVEEIVQDKEVEFAVFYDEKEKALTTKSSEPSEVVQKRLLVFSKDINDSSGEKIGSFKIGYNHKSTKRAVAVITTIISVAIIIVVVILSIGISFIVGRISKPIVDLKNSIVSVGESNDFSARVKIRSKDEIGQTAEAFNHMMDALQAAIQKVNRVMSAISTGDFTKTVDIELSGDLEALKKDINGTVSSVKDTMTYLNEVIGALSEGNFHYSVDNSLKGEFKYSVDNALKTMKNMATTIGDINGVMSAVSSGDLSARIVVDAKGDLQVLKNSINASLVAIGQTMTSIVESTSRVAQSAAQTNIAVEQVTEGSQTQVQSIADVANAVSVTSDGITEVTKNAEVASESARKSSTIVDIGQNKMEHMMGLVRAVAANNERINKITEVIGGIANQTNLLSLNAAIEAARAGEHGKGFAVVADEVRKLAEDSSKSVDEISKLVDEAVRSVNKAVEASEEVNSEMVKIAEISSESEIMLGKIAESMGQQNSTIIDINKNIASLNEIAENNASAAEEITAIVNDLASMSNSTKEQVEKFKL